MNYNELKQIAKRKNILIKDLAKETGITRQGLQKVMDNETIELKLVKRICEKLDISPAKFFDTGTFGLILNNGVNQVVGNGNKMIIENKDKEIEMLRQQIADKEEIIKLLKNLNQKL